MGELEAISAGWLSILPPLIAIALALITKEVYSSLIIGCFSGMLIYCLSTGGGIIQSIYYMIVSMGEKLGDNGTLIIFLAFLGALVVVITRAGGSKAYGNWAAAHIKTRSGAMFSTFLLGILIFIDDYFNCLTVGTVMRPLTDKHKISREKLAYIIDATAAPICIIAPISSWAAAVASDLGGDGFGMFIQAIPYNLYALLTIAMVIMVCFFKMDYGPMRKAEMRAAAGEIDNTIGGQDFDGMEVSEHGRVFDLLIPVIALIVFSILCMAYVGGFFSGDLDFISAIGEDPSTGLALGSFFALVVALIMFVPRKLISFRDFMKCTVDGVKSMIPAIAILVLAWTLSGVCRYMIGTGEFVSGIVSGSSILNLLPVFVFVVAAFLSFSMGTAWGTFGILLPIVAIICSVPDAAPMMIPAMGATLAGSVFGDHCSPISDTTILASAGAKCDHIKHVSTQLPYALTVAVLCGIGYLLIGLTGSCWLSLGICLALMIGFFIFMRRRENNRPAEETAE